MGSTATKGHSYRVEQPLIHLWPTPTTDLRAKRCTHSPDCPCSGKLTQSPPPSTCQTLAGEASQAAFLSSAQPSSSLIGALEVGPSSYRPCFCLHQLGGSLASDCDPLCSESPPSSQPHLRAASPGVKGVAARLPGISAQNGTVDSRETPAEPAANCQDLGGTSRCVCAPRSKVTFGPALPLGTSALTQTWHSLATSTRSSSPVVGLGRSQGPSGHIPPFFVCVP